MADNTKPQNPVPPPKSTDTSPPQSEKASSLSSSKPHEPDSNTVEKAAPAGPGPPPNGGTKAWLQVAGGFLLVLNTWCVRGYQDSITER